MAVTIKKVMDEVSSDTEESGNTINFTDHDAKIAELAYYKAESVEVLNRVTNLTTGLMQNKNLIRRVYPIPYH